MSGKRSAVIAAFVIGTGVAAVSGQSSAVTRGSTGQKQSRYQIGVMERVLEGAVEHGVSVTRDRLQAVLPPRSS